MNSPTLWWNRIFNCLVALTICAATSLSIGSGRAAAVGPEQVAEAAEEAAPVVAAGLERAGLGALGKPLETVMEGVKRLFSLQWTGLTPAADKAALSGAKNQWMAFVPRTRALGEVAPVGGKLPSTYEAPSGMLCRAALDLLNQPNPTKPGWQWAIKNASNEVMSLEPAGKKLVIYNDLNDINDKFQHNRFCAGTAELALFFAKETVCE
jgi:hypothetical protein